jgi:glutamate N-acetyltransferase/amino-acid N-acetyltransferase
MSGTAMPVVQPGVGLPVRGVRLSTAAGGIRYRNRDDLVLIEMAAGGSAAAVFTRNRFCAAPVLVAREHLRQDPVRYLLINSGNANAGTGEPGLRAARETCHMLASLAGCAMSQVLPFSTGVIGEDLPLPPFQQAMPALLQGLAEDAWARAAKAIMTTDTRPKLCAIEVPLGGATVTVTGMAKGSGMIRPDMATMLAYVATDAAVGQALLQDMLEQAVAPSFNSITVDGDTSTNDACVLLASGASGVAVAAGSAEARQLQQALDALCMHLAREIVRDGEGATKLVEIVVDGAATAADARAVAYTVAHSPLVKTAMFASDPNWGRILAAVGRADIQEMDLDAIRICLDEVLIVSKGGRDPGYREEDGQRVMQRDAYEVRIELGMGQAHARVLTCDFSFDYVKINAEYRS